MRRSQASALLLLNASRRRREFQAFDIAGNILWLRADDPRIEVTGLGVSLATDKSGLGNNGVQGTDLDRPALNPTGWSSGHPTIDFDWANGEFLDFTGLADASNDYTFFVSLNELNGSGGWTEMLFVAISSGFQVATDRTGNVAIFDVTWKTPLTLIPGEQVLAWRLNSSAGTVEIFRDGVLLGVGIYSGTRTISGTVQMGWQAASNYLDARVADFIIYNRALLDAEMAQVHGYMLPRYRRAFSPLSVANCGAWWDLDHATITADELIALTDRALGQTINVVGSPAVVSVGGQDFVRFDGSDDVLWIVDAAALDGAAGSTHVLKHANAESLPNNTTIAQKGRSGAHFNGGLSGELSSGTRFTAAGHSANVADVGPLAEFTSPAETIAQAFEGGVAVRRVDGDGTYASTAVAATTVVGAGALTWGGRDAGAGPTFDDWMKVELRAGVYYARPINEQELIAVHNFLGAA